MSSVTCEFPSYRMVGDELRLAEDIPAGSDIELVQVLVSDAVENWDRTPKTVWRVYVSVQGRLVTRYVLDEIVKNYVLKGAVPTRPVSVA